jgi:hypothetical protein
MKKWILLTLGILITSPAWANQKVSEALQAFAWEKRQLIVFTASTNDPKYQLFLKVSNKFLEEFEDRKLHIWHVIAGQKVKLDEQTRVDLKASDFQKAFGINGTKFKVLLIGYDQQEKLRQDNVQIDDLFAEIDQMPMRIQEMQESLD